MPVSLPNLATTLEHEAGVSFPKEIIPPPKTKFRLPGEAVASSKPVRFAHGKVRPSWPWGTELQVVQRMGVCCPAQGTSWSRAPWAF